jgi:hypothetical protein
MLEIMVWKRPTIHNVILVDLILGMKVMIPNKAGIRGCPKDPFVDNITFEKWHV